jgi:protein arginine kinase activator
MLCQDCSKREAQIHLTQIINNEKMTLSLCRECAEARGFHSPLDNVPFPLAEILSGLAKPHGPDSDREPMEDISCPACGLTFVQFTRQGRFGCGTCYSAFRPRLETIMRKIHGASIHRGRNPEFAKFDDAEGMLPVREEERLDRELGEAIQNEDFERAAELRDKLKAVRQKVTVNDPIG